MPALSFSVRVWCSAGLFLLLLSSPVLSGGLGEAYRGQYDDACRQLNGDAAMTFGRMLPGWNVNPEVSFAFYSGPEGGNQCLTTLQDPDGYFIDGLSFNITVMEGIVLEELTTPYQTSIAPLESCWPKDFVFEDLNGDRITDILMLIGCFNKATDAPRNDNVVYLSALRGDQLWLEQQPAMNRAVSCYEVPELAVAAVKAVLAE